MAAAVRCQLSVSFLFWLVLTLPAHLGTEPMENETLERWQDLCQQAATEQDHHRFLELTREIIQMLTEKERQLSQLAKPGRVVRS